MLNKISNLIMNDLIMRPIAFMYRKEVEFYIKHELFDESCVYAVIAVRISIHDVLFNYNTTKAFERTAYKAMIAVKAYFDKFYEKCGIDLNSKWIAN